MPAQRVLVVDENQSFCMQVIAAFSEAEIEARGSARGNEALLVAASFNPDLVIVDLVRPGSEGRWLLQRLCARNDDAPVAPLPRLVLALAPVVGDYSDLPEGVEIVVKPIFASQVVAAARRLLGPATGSPRMWGPAGGLQSGSGQLPIGVSSRPPVEAAAEHTMPPGGAPLDEFDDDSDFGPADTLLAPAASISELARSMVLVPDSPREGAGAAPLLSQNPTLLLDLGSGLAHGPGSTSDETLPLVEFNLRRELSGQVEPVSPDQGAGAQPRSGRMPASGLGMSPSEADREALSGSLAAIPILDVLSMLARQCQTGVLRVMAASSSSSSPGGTGSPSRRRFELILRRGQLEQAVAVGLPSLRLGRFVLELETLRQPELDAVAAARGKRSPRSDEDGEAETGVPGVPMEPEYLLGARLCAAGLLNRDELRVALQRQTIELVYEALRLPHGRFLFSRTRELPRWAIEPEYGAGLGLDIEALLLEGARRADDWYQLDLDTSEGAVYVSTVSPQQDVRQLGLSAAECAVLALCSGRHVVGDIAKESRLSLLDVSRTLGRLQALRLCRRRLPVVLAS